jgi:hypothetical protein
LRPIIFRCRLKQASIQASVHRKWREDPQTQPPPTQEPRIWVDEMESI